MKRIFTASLFVIACALAQAVSAQSTDQSLPTPVLSNDISGKIAALDVGDPRATRHFYAFAASPGDLLITVDCKNLDGDVDVFTAITFRPLMKTTVYATSQSPSVTKGIYLRAHQLLILRIEARTPSDDPGTYRIHFGGTFEPFSGGIPVAENTESTERSNEKVGANRLSSVGATIPRPPAEIVETAEAKPAPDKAEEKSTEKPAKAETEKSATTSRANTRPPRRTSRPTTTRRQPPAKTESPTKTEADAAKTEPKVEPEKSQPAKKGTSKVEKTTEAKSVETRASETASEKSRAQEVTAPPVGARLIIEQKDGTRIDRPMSTVRRVVVEGATIVVMLKNGKTERIAMADVARMSIEPQQ